jgi:hypothetical protein
MKDDRYRDGGTWRCREKKRAAGRRHAARVQADPIRLERKKLIEKSWTRKNAIYIRYKAYAHEDRKRGFQTIEKEAALALMSSPCFYCKTMNADGLDRRDSAGGHTPDNVVSCCMECNTLLTDLPAVAKDMLADGLQKIREAGLFENWIIPQMRRSA